MRVEPFTLAVPAAVLDDLRARVRATRWPGAAPGRAWSQGVDLGYLRGLLAHWADGYDWRIHERALNRYEHRLSDSGGDLDATFGRDSLLTMLTIWWVTESVTSSMRDYYDNRWHGVEPGPDDRVRVPTAMAVFPNEFVPEGEVPRSWYERLYQVERWTVFPHGGHFAAAEVPDLLAGDIAEFFSSR